MGVTASGLITYVETATRGSQTYAAATAGDPSIVVSDVSAFHPDGGRIDIGQALSPLVYTSAVVNPDGPTGTLALAGDLAADVAEGVRVDLWVRRGPATYFIATVDIGDDEVTAYLPVHLIPHLEGGPRAVGEGEYVELKRERGKWLVVDAPLQVPAMDLGFADGTKPVTPGAVTSSPVAYPDEWANQWPAELLQSGQMTADIRVAGSLTTGGTQGRGVTLYDDHGFFTVQPDQTTRSAAPNDPDQPDIWRGDTNADRLTSRSASFGGESTIEADSSLIFGSSLISAPLAVPSVRPYWETATYTGPHKADNKAGFAAGSAPDAYCLIVRRGDNPPPPMVARFDVGTGLFDDTFKFATTPGLIAGIAWSVLRNRLITLEWAAGWQVNYWDLTAGLFVYEATHSWTWTDGDPPDGSNSPAISCRTLAGDDRILIAQSQPDGTVKIRPYDDAAPAAVVTTTTPVDAGNLVGVADTLTSAVLAAGRSVMLDGDGNTQLAMVTMASGAVDYLAVGNNNTACAGLARSEADIASGFYYLSSADQAIIRHHAVADGGYWWAQCAWYKIAGTGQTTPGPAVRFTKAAGSSLVVSMSDCPPAADSIMVYIGAGTTQPANGAMWLQAIPLIPGRVSLVVPVIVTSAAPNPLTVGTLMGSSGGRAAGSDGSVIFDSTYSNANTLPYRVALLEAGGGGGGGGSGSGISIHCGNAAASGVSIHCGGAA